MHISCCSTDLLCFVLDNVLMGHKFMSGHGLDEVMLMPADPREWLPDGHLAWKVLDLAAEMDLSAFGQGYRADGQGGRPYHPRMMATLLLYCYCRGRRSSREIEMATFDDVGARVICGGLHPDHSTVAEFVRRNAGAVLALLPESVKACAAEGLVDLSLVAGDGTKLKANAAMAGNLTREQLEKQIAELEAWIDAEFRSWVQDMLDGEGTAPAGAGAAPRGGGGPGDGGKKWKNKPARAGQMLQRRLAARARLDARQGAERDKAQGSRDARVAELAARVARKEAALARWEGKAQARIDARAARTAAGQRPRGPAPLPVSADREVTRARQALADARADHAAALAGTGAGERRPDGRRRPGRPDKPGGAKAADGAGQPAREATVSPADPSSRVMPLKKGGYDQLFNVQALATARTQVILAITRHDSPVDVQALQPLMEQARCVLDEAGINDEILKALFDAGYASDANFTLDIPAMLYIAVTRESRQTGRSADGRAPDTMLPSWQEMTARLATKEGKQLYRQRAATIEPVFAQLTARLGRTLNYRGNLVDAELALWAASHNILKAITARARRLARQAATASTAPAPAAA
jgi:transposase